MGNWLLGFNKNSSSATVYEVSLFQYTFSASKLKLHYDKKMPNILTKDRWLQLNYLKNMITHCV